MMFLERSQKPEFSSEEAINEIGIVVFSSRRYSLLTPDS
jgi:hypothetical protein